MRLLCPECDTRLNVPDDTADDDPIECPKCETVFTPADEPRPRRKKSRPASPKSNLMPVALASVGGVLAVAAVVVFAIMSRSKPDPVPTEVAANSPAPVPFKRHEPEPVVTRPTPPPPTPVVTPPVTTPPGTGPVSTLPRPGRPPRTPPTFPPRAGGPFPGSPPPGSPFTPPVVSTNSLSVHADLFRAAIDSKPPTIRAASLKPTVADQVPEVPTFYSLIAARKEAKSLTAAVPKAARLSLEEVKRACAYIKVDAGELSGTGSGFLIASRGPTGLIATNYHVIESAAGSRFDRAGAKITVVFNSGQPDEREMRADIVAYDPAADLAVLWATAPGPWPKPLSPYNTPPKVSEGLPIQFWGFPLGDTLSSGKKNPEITLGTGTVSSLRRTTSGKLDRVQISGTMNPGNSGGPLVDADGRLVGIAVSIINPKIGTGIGFAVPVNDLIALLEGKLLTTLFVPTGLEGGEAKFVVFVPVMDPLDKVDTVYIRRWAGDGTPPDAVKDPFTGFKPFAMRKDGKANLPGAQEFPLKKFLTEGDAASGLGIAIGDMTVPADAPQVLIQVASQTGPNAQTGARYTAASKPVGYTLSVSDLPVGTDARPFADLTTNPDALADQVIVVKGRIVSPPNTRDAIQDLNIVGPDGRRPDRMRFLVDAEQAAQFDEVVLEHQPLPVRLVCLVGKRGADGIVPVRVARFDFISRGNRVVRTIPAQDGATDDLAALNRNPAKFAGRTLEMKVSAVPLTLKSRDTNEFTVVFPNQRFPRNLAFTVSNSMKQRLFDAFGRELRPNMIVPVRLTAAVPPQPAPPNAKTTIPVSKIEFLDEDGKVIKAIE